MTQMTGVQIFHAGNPSSNTRAAWSSNHHMRAPEHRSGIALEHYQVWTQSNKQKIAKEVIFNSFHRGISVLVQLVRDLPGISLPEFYPCHSIWSNKLPGVIPESKTRDISWALLGVAKKNLSEWHLSERLELCSILSFSLAEKFLFLYLLNFQDWK